MMKRRQKLKLLQEWAQHHRALEELHESLVKTVGDHPQMPIREVPWEIFDAYTTQLAHRLECWYGGEVTSDLHWYWQECGMGKTPMDAVAAELKRSVGSLNSLLDLIEATNQ